MNDINNNIKKQRIKHILLSIDLNDMQTFVLLSSTTITMIVVLFFLVIGPLFRTTFAQLTGKDHVCENEGEPIILTDIREATCFNCFCKNKIVQCLKLECPTDLRDCDKLREIQKFACCQDCIDGLPNSPDEKSKESNNTNFSSDLEEIGCIKDEVYYKSDTDWIDPTNHCIAYTCFSGVITESLINCVTPCDDPEIPKPGQCCNSCRKCRNNLRKISDPCVSCNCTLGLLTCTKKICPILNCEKSQIVYDSNKCCPYCKETKKKAQLPKDSCMIGTAVYKEGTNFKFDDCTSCSCRNSTIHCKRDICSIPNCPAKQRENVPGQCCPQCRKPEQKKKEENEKEDGDHDGKDDQETKLEKNYCSHSSTTYENGKDWITSNCEKCTCNNGNVSCTTVMCPLLRCPTNSDLTIPDGQCCPVCEERQVICTVYSGTHFRTFDGKLYTFFGSCRYQLVSDCDSRSFQIRLKNDIIDNEVTMKRISLKLNKMRVDLQQNRNTKVNDLIVDLPYRSETHNIEIISSKSEVSLTWKSTLKVRWNYLGVLEISLPSMYRKKVCGLCGNFNDVADDDLTTRENILVEDPAIFAQSWAAGDEVCLNTRKHGTRGCHPQRDKRLCSYIKGSVFERCLRKINVTSYYERCLKDMCDCHVDDPYCHCESFTSYIHDCERFGIFVSDWRPAVGCFVN